MNDVIGVADRILYRFISDHAKLKHPRCIRGQVIICSQAGDIHDETQSKQQERHTKYVQDKL